MYVFSTALDHSFGGTCSRDFRRFLAALGELFIALDFLLLVQNHEGAEHGGRRRQDQPRKHRRALLGALLLSRWRWRRFINFGFGFRL